MQFTVEAYQDDAKKAYGEKCEFVGCGWDAATCDVHHIDYQEQQAFEKKMRAAAMIDLDAFKVLQLQAHEKGWGDFNKKTRQLGKNHSLSNLTVLCPNHHRYLHQRDMGLKILEYIPKRM